ncbi:NAD(P)-dependent oxidoreductase [Rhodophyticola sp. MJ-SS7]|nr:NAD(P)-dependent oxidoreductase [Rhodophyticola sp. MJ-SS7]
MSKSLQDKLGQCLITGATGFIGTVVAEMLVERGAAVRALVRPTSNTARLSALGVELAIGDITDPSSLGFAFRNVDTVIHLAVVRHAIGSGPDAGRVEHRAGNREVILGGMRNVAEAAVTAGARRMVLSSSAGVSGDHGYSTISETTPEHPNRPYRVLRLDAEKTLRQICKETGLAATICRVTHTYGPGDPTMVRVFRLIARQSFTLIGSGRQYNHFSYVDDIADAIIASAAVATQSAPVYLIGSEPLRLWDFLTIIAEETGGKVKRKAWLDPIIRPAAFLYERMGQPFKAQLPGVENLDFHVNPRRYDLSKARADLDLRRGVPVREAVRKTANWYRRQGLL